MVKIVTKSPQELAYIGQRLAKFLNPGDFIALDGELGAGKTTLTQGLAKGLEIKQVVNSPTFTIIHEYDKGSIPLYHMDVYRLDSVKEMDDLGYEEYFYGEGITVVEWASKIESILPETYLGMMIMLHPEGRVLAFKPVGSHYEQIIEELTGCDYSKYR